MRIVKIILKTIKGIFIGILTVFFLLNAVSIAKRVFLKENLPLVLGMGTAVIITGSMEPAIMPGDMVIIRRQTDYRVNDIVTYSANTPVTHRIIEITPHGYITQGDANNADDGEIEKSRIVGKVIVIVPHVGKLVSFFQSSLGILTLILGFFAIMEFPRLFHKAVKGPKKEEAPALRDE